MKNMTYPETVERYAAKISKRLPSHSLIDKEDLLQSGFLATIDSDFKGRIYGSMIDQIRLMNPIVTWEKSVQRRKSARSVKEVSLSAYGSGKYDPWQHVNRAIDSKDMVGRVFRRVKQPRWRTVMELRLHDYRNVEIASAMNISETRVHELWKKIRKDVGAMT